MTGSRGAKRHPSRKEGEGASTGGSNLTVAELPPMAASLADVIWAHEGGVGEEP